LTEARYVLKRAESLFKYRRVSREFGDVERPDPHAATLLLRDLALRLGELSGDDLRAARAILARPDDPQGDQYGTPYQAGPHPTLCSPTFSYCLHWADPGDPNAPQQTDEDGNGRPDFVDDAVLVMDEVIQTMTSLGYRLPKSDATSKPNGGPDGKTDIYLADIGSDGIYGYCTTDDPNASKQFLINFDFSAYCVLDNDYAGFPRTPPENLRVTAAHEFFHAIQFAYDAAEDFWLMEGTAVAIEDIVYDEINDNLQFLIASQLTGPLVSLDWGPFDDSQPNFGYQYGAWLWWRFMTEYLSPVPGQRDDTIIRKVWERADSSKDAAFNDEYSLKAAMKVAKMNYSTGFKKLFSQWGLYLFQPERFDEGTEYVSFLQAFHPDFQGHAPVTRSFTLSGGSPASGRFLKRLDHLTSSFYRFTPGSGVGPNDLLKVRVNGPDRRQGASATLLYSNGANSFVKRFTLNKFGNGAVKIKFPDEAILILQNSSTRVKDCYENFQSLTSCMGIPRDDGRLFRANAKLIRG
jgi:hypothetical protein